MGREEAYCPAMVSGMALLVGAPASVRTVSTLPSLPLALPRRVLVMAAPEALPSARLALLRSQAARLSEAAARARNRIRFIGVRSCRLWMVFLGKRTRAALV